MGRPIRSENERLRTHGSEFLQDQFPSNTSIALNTTQIKKSDSLFQSYWEPRYLTFALSPLKSLLAGKTLGVREFMVTGWAKYFREGGLEHASEFARAMYDQMKVDGLSEDDLARAQVGHSHAITATTGPVAWWLIYHIFSDPAVLADVVSVRSISFDFPVHIRPAGCTVIQATGCFSRDTCPNITRGAPIC